MKILQIISSRNRPMQLDLLLRSIQDNWSECNQIFIIIKYDNDLYREGYAKLIHKHNVKNFGNWKKSKGNKYEFIIQDNYKEDLIIKLYGCRNDYILMNSDDNVFISKVFDLPAKLYEKEICFSLRLGNKINYCLPAKLKIKLPTELQKAITQDNAKKIIWDWTECDSRGAYGYPQPYDSHIYRKQWLIDLIKVKEFKNPFTLENVLNTNRDFSKPYMIAFEEPKLINIMANITGQNDNPNMKGCGLSCEELNKKWLDGWQIKTDGIYGIKPTQCHIFHKYEFEK